MQARTDEEMREALEDLGYPVTQENADHLAVLLEVMDLYCDRSETYGQVWKQYGALRNLVQAAAKVDRLMAVWWHNTGDLPAMHKDALDDAFDGMAFLAFFIRMARIGNITGFQPTRPGLRLVE